MRKSLIALTTAAIMGFAGNVLASGPVMLTDGEMDQVVAGDHVLRLVEFRTGIVPPTQSATDALNSAGSVGGVGQDRPNIIRLLP